jgi:hypothetical protein
MKECNLTFSEVKNENNTCFYVCYNILKSMAPLTLTASVFSLIAIMGMMTMVMRGRIKQAAFVVEDKIH